MGDAKERLRQTLYELHEELAAVGEVDPNLRSELETALGDILHALHQDLPAESWPESIGHRLDDLSQRFQQSQPTLSHALGTIIDALGRMGI